MPQLVDSESREKRQIEAILSDGTQLDLEPRVLDVMLDNDRVIRFRRSSGWVTVGIDPVRSRRRGMDGPIYYGVERRISATTHSVPL